MPYEMGSLRVVKLARTFARLIYSPSFVSVWSTRGSEMPHETGEGPGQPALSCRLIRSFSGRTYHTECLHGMARCMSTYPRSCNDF